MFNKNNKTNINCIENRSQSSGFVVDLRQKVNQEISRDISIWERRAAGAKNFLRINWLIRRRKPEWKKYFDRFFRI